MAEFKIDDIVKYSFDGIPGYGIVTKVTSKKFLSMILMTKI